MEVNSLTKSGDFHTALPLLENMTSDQLLQLTLPDKCTPLHYACQHGRVDVAQQLITHCKYSIESKDGKGHTPLHTAAQYGQVSTLKYLLHNLFIDEILSLSLKFDSTLAHTLAFMFQLKLLDRHKDRIGNTPLHTACVHGQLDIVQLLTHEIGCDPNNTNSEGLSCLHLASQHGHLPLVRYLIEEVGSDVTLEDEHGRSPTYLAAGGGHLDILKYLIGEKGSDPHYTTSKEWNTAEFIIASGRSLVHTASREGHLHVVRYLVEQHGCDPSHQDDEGVTPLYLACQQGHMDLVTYLITERNSDPNYTSKNSRTGLHAACWGGHLDVVKYLLEIHHSDLLYPDEDKTTPVHCVASNGQLEVLSYFAITKNLLKKKNNNNTPLHLAALQGHLKVIKFIIEDMKCDPDSKGKFERTPLHHASENGHLEVVKYLVETHDCNPLCTDKDNSTPLHRAAANGRLEVLSYFAITRNCSILIGDSYNNTPLHYAALQGHLKVIKFIIEDMKCDPDSKSQLERTPLHHASQNGHLEVVKYLVETHGCNPLCTDNRNSTPLHRAGANGRLEVLSYFAITRNCSILIRDIYNDTPLHYASLQGHLKVIKFIIEDMKCDPDSKGEFERTPLYHASENGHLEVVKYLVETHGCNPLCTDMYNSTPLHRAGANGRLEVLSYFAITRNCSILIRDIYNDTPLHYASLQGHLKVIKFIIEDMKCDPDSKGEFERTPLHHASENGHLEVVKYLVETHGCNPLCTDMYNSTPLHLAASNDRLEVFSYFAITYKCSILIKDSYNHTPLHYAALQGHLKVIKFIIEDMKCDPDCKGQLERTPLHHASQNGHLEVVKYLVETHHCNPLCTDEDNNTPLHRAATNGHLEIISYFGICHNVDLRNLLNKTPLHYASQYGHHEFESYLLRATTIKPVFQKYIISPSLSIFVVGNSGSGKSTLVKALCTETNFWGSIISVKGVTPLTAGIVPMTINSQVFGSVNIYDFAGHEEYYASHEMIFQQISHPLVLLTINISLPQQKIEEQLLYWLSVLSETSHVVVIGSHADQVKFKERTEIQSKVKSLLSNKSSIVYHDHGFIQCDCRYSSSDNLDKLRQTLNTTCRLIQHVLAANETSKSNKLCACLMYYLKNNMPEQDTITVSQVLKHARDSSSDFVHLEDQSVLIQTCKKLSSNGHLLFMPNHEKLENSLLVLDNEIILDKVHACLTDIKKALSNALGIVEKKQLIAILSVSLKDVMEPEHAIKYLILTQFCTEITAEQLNCLSDSMDFYFFPNLISASKPDDLLPAGDLKYTHLYTWCLKCSNARQFFTPRYLHTLFIQLIKYERSEVSSDCQVWKNGILLVHSNGTRSIIEVTDQTTRIYLTIQCIEGCESQLVKQRSHLISFIKRFTKKACPSVKVEESLLLPQVSYSPESSTQVQVSRVAHSIVNGYQYTPQHVRVEDLLFFDSFQAIRYQTLRKIFTHRLTDNVVPLTTVTGIHSAVETCRELQEWFEDEAGQCRRDMTYSQLYRELIKYSIFTDGNLYVSCWSF